MASRASHPASAAPRAPTASAEKQVHVVIAGAAPAVRNAGQEKRRTEVSTTTTTTTTTDHATRGRPVVPTTAVTTQNTIVHNNVPMSPRQPSGPRLVKSRQAIALAVVKR